MAAENFFAPTASGSPNFPMSMTLEDTPSAKPDFLPPLQKHTRSEAVTAQLTDLGHVSRASVLRRAASEDRATRPALETLIALVRAYLRAGDRPAADAVLEALVPRLRKAVGPKVAAWGTVRLPDQENAVEEAVLRLLQYVSSVTPSEEFWECNFTHCFGLRIITILRDLSNPRHAGPQTVSLSGVSDEGDEQDGLANLPDASSEADFTDVEAREAVAALGRDNPQIGQYLFLVGQGYKDLEIAAILKVETRTLRNWKAKAREAWGGWETSPGRKRPPSPSERRGFRG